MDIREFAQDFLNEVKASVEMNGTDYDQELASLIFDYMEDNGEVNNPEICSFQKTRTRITAYDYNDDACLLYTSPSPRDGLLSRMPSSA